MSRTKRRKGATRRPMAFRPLVNVHRKRKEQKRTHTNSATSLVIGLLLTLVIIGALL